MSAKHSHLIGLFVAAFVLRHILISLSTSGFGTIFKKVVPVLKYSSLDEEVMVGDTEMKLSDMLSDLVNS